MMGTTKWNPIVVLFTALILATVFLLSINSIADFDTGYHLKTGEYIIGAKTVPLYDIFSYTASHARWIAHYWLADVIFFSWYMFFGLPGLIFGVAALAALTYFFVLQTARLRARTHLKNTSSLRCERISCIRKACRGSCSPSYCDRGVTQRDKIFAATPWGYGQFPQYLRRLLLGVHQAHLRRRSLVLRKLAYIASGGISEMGSGSAYPPLLLLVPYVLLTFELWVVRPQVFTYLWAALLIFLLERSRSAGYSLKSLCVIPPIFFLWGNMHAGVVLGLLILFVYVGAALIAKKFQLASLKTLLVLAVFSFLAVLVNPNGYQILNYPNLVASATKELPVVEWLSLLKFLDVWQADIFLFLMTAVLVFVLFRTVKKAASFFDFDWAAAGLVILAFALPLISIRHVGLFPILTFPIVIRELDEFLFGRDIKFDSVNLMGVLLFFSTVAFMVQPILSLPKNLSINKHLLPVGAVDFLKAQNIHGPMFNIPAQGGYLIWKLWPEEKVFIDGRSEVYLGAPDRDFLTIMRTSPGWEKLVNDKYKFNYFLLWYREPLRDVTRNLFAELTQKMNFRLVYWDDAAIVLLRDTPENHNVVSRFGYSLISPFLDPYSIPKINRAEVVGELKRALEISPDSVILQNFLK